MLTDPAECGPVTLAFCQDVQAEAYDYPESFFAERVHRPRRQPPDAHELADAVAALHGAKKPFVICGGGVLYSEAERELLAFCEKHGIPIAETQAGKSATPADHPLHVGAIGVTGTDAANRLAEEADVVLAVGTRLSDFTTGSWALFKNPDRRFIGLNVQPFDAAKHRALPLVADARAGLAALDAALGDWRAPAAWPEFAAKAKREWLAIAARYLAPTNAATPDRRAGARRPEARWAGLTTSWSARRAACPANCTNCGRRARRSAITWNTAIPAWATRSPAALGVKLAHPDREVIVVVGDGSYLMMNSEIATSVMLGLKLIIVVNDNRGFACINRLQRATGGESFNNLLRDARHEALPEVDFVAHARSLGAQAVKAASIAELESALEAAREAKTTQVIVIDTDPMATTDAGGAWWEVAVPAVSTRPEVASARSNYEKALASQRVGD